MPTLKCVQNLRVTGLMRFRQGDSQSQGRYSLFSSVVCDGHIANFCSRAVGQVWNPLEVFRSQIVDLPFLLFGLDCASHLVKCDDPSR